MTTAFFSLERAPSAPRSIANVPSFDRLLAPIQRCAAYFLRKLPKQRREELMADVVLGALAERPSRPPIAESMAPAAPTIAQYLRELVALLSAAVWMLSIKSASGANKMKFLLR
jgi:hypothetical protein